MEETIDGWYATERRAGVIFAAFAGLTAFITGLGLIGLASFMAERRTKEIGIRKVLGASVSGILLLLSRQYLAWIFPACALAWPIAYILVHNWLKSFAYRIEFGIAPFLFSTGLALVLTLSAVGVQSLRSALANPVESLRYE